MANVPLAFFFVALVMLVGFVTSRVFQATRVPDIPILICIGLIVGPLNRAAGVAGLEGLHSEFLASNFNVDTFRSVAPFFSQLALIVILFDSGMRLDVRQVASVFRPAIAHTFPLLVCTVLGIAAIAYALWDVPAVIAVVLGVALSNVGQTVSAAIIRELRISTETRSIYFIEMSLYDVLSIPLLVGLLELAKTGGAPNAVLFAESITRVASVSVLMGVVGGGVWILVLTRLKDYPYTYMVTLATLLLVYSVTSFVGGSGAISALVFGLVVGNRNGLLQRFRSKARVSAEEGEKLSAFHDEIAFFIRSFFFVFLGVIFSTGARTDPETGEPLPWNVAASWWPASALNGTAGLFLIGCALILGAIVGIRWLVVRYVSSRGRPERMSLWAVYGRGLGTAVLCTFPFTLREYEDPTTAYFAFMSPFESLFFNAALLIILGTVVATSLTVLLEERRLARAAPS